MDQLTIPVRNPASAADNAPGVLGSDVILLTAKVKELVAAVILLTAAAGTPAAPAPVTSASAASAFLAATTKQYPAAGSYNPELAVNGVAPLTVRASVATFNTGAASYTIQNRVFRNDSGWVADIYMPGGQPILVQHCVFLTASANDLIHITDNSRVTVQNCIFICDGVQPVGTARARALYAYNPASITFQNNYLLNTAGGKIERWSGTVVTDTISWLRNRYDNICGGGGDYRQALQLQQVQGVAGIEIAYNQVVNTPGQSRVEDNFNIYESSGIPTSPLHLHHNYVEGAYPANPTDGGFTGTGLTTDAGGTDRTPAQMPSYVLAENNRFTRCMNACMNIAAGHHITYQGNTCVVAGVAADGTKFNGVNNAVAIFKGSAYSDAQFDYNQITGNTIRVNQAGGEQPYYANVDAGPNSKALTAGNSLNTYVLTATYADEQQVFADWQQDLVANQVLIGA